MDKFEEMLQEMQKTTDTDRKQMIDKAKGMCICGECPTYNDCMERKMELLFCATGKSSCTTTKKACVCPTCPVTPMMGLKFAYYCVNGSERELRKLK